MACFLVPTTEAIVTTVAAKAMKEKEKKETSATAERKVSTEDEGKTSFSRKLKWLNNMLWGGSALLAFEHVWHGEVVPWFPFLTAAGNSEDAAVMLQEMSTVGVTMAVLVTAVWAGMAAVSNVLEKRPVQITEAEKEAAL